MRTITRSARAIRFSLPADPPALLLFRRVIREIARGTSLNRSEIANLQAAATEAFCRALVRQMQVSAGQVAVEVRACSDDVTVRFTQEGGRVHVSQLHTCSSAMTALGARVSRYSKCKFMHVSNN